MIIEAFGRRFSIEEKDLVPVPGQDYSILPYRVKTVDGDLLADLTWVEVKQIEKEVKRANPTLSYASSEHVERAKSLGIVPETESTDSYVSFRSRNGFSPNIQNDRLEEFKDSEAIMIVGSTVDITGDRYVIRGGTIYDASDMAMEQGFIQKWNKERGYPTEVGPEPNPEFEESYLIVDRRRLDTFIVRDPLRIKNGGYPSPSYNIAADLPLLFPCPYQGFRLIKRN